MSTVTAVPIHPLKKGSVAKLWLGIALLVGAALLLAWAGAGRMVGVAVRNRFRPEGISSDFTASGLSPLPG